MKKYFAALLVTCFLVLMACTANDTDEVPEFVTRNTLYASYEIPGSWTISDMHSTDAVVIYHPAHIDVMLEPSNVTVEIHPTGQPAEVYEDIRDEFHEFMEGMLELRGETAEIISHDHFEAHFGEVIVTVLNDDFEGRTFVQTQHYLLVDDYFVFVVATDFHDDDVDDAAEVARHIIDTIQFNNLADVPMPTMPPRPFGGEWNNNVYTNDILGIHFALPENWMPFSRDMVTMYFGPEAEQLIEVMAVSDQEEMVQVFLSFSEPEWGVDDFLLDFAGQIDAAGTASTDEIIEVVIAGQTYLSNVSFLEDETGAMIVQETFARELEGNMILAITFIYHQEAQSDAIGFLEAALGE
ncbi:MAG: hypothetical protein FWE20_12125 [Defluviitaleaceae bacterium]|nr:hypothetical protein [Defluviitaleaceae bacterium]